MISILIPIYNFDVSRLVYTIHKQGLQLAVPFEIICIDDASAKQYVISNKKIASLDFVQAHWLDKNIGRSKIRNRLAELSAYDYLLYMDCDSMPVEDSFLANYLRHIAPNQILYGGRVYQNQKPKDASLLFHWKYGSERETTAALQRSNFPYQSFMTNNFLVPKAVLEAIKFDEDLKLYGHEDTLFGLELKKRNIAILHLDNPLMHIGLEDKKVFLAKTRKGIENLYFLQQKYDLGAEIKLLRYYLHLNNWHLSGLVLFFLKLLKPILLYNLYSPFPSLLAFDLYKLAVLLEQKNLSQ